MFAGCNWWTLKELNLKIPSQITDRSAIQIYIIKVFQTNLAIKILSSIKSSGPDLVTTWSYSLSYSIWSDSYLEKHHIIFIANPIIKKKLNDIISNILFSSQSNLFHNRNHLPIYNLHNESSHHQSKLVRHIINSPRRYITIIQSIISSDFSYQDAFDDIFKICRFV